jgi:hypothetical protein
MASRMCKGFSENMQNRLHGLPGRSVVNRYVHILMSLPLRAGIANNNAL